jgi:hypothetical protein
MNYDVILIPCGIIPEELMDQLKALAHRARRPALFGISNTDLLVMSEAERMIHEVVKNDKK